MLVQNPKILNSRELDINTSHHQFMDAVKVMGFEVETLESSIQNWNSRVIFFNGNKNFLVKIVYSKYMVITNINYFPKHTKRKIQINYDTDIDIKKRKGQFADMINIFITQESKQSNKQSNDEKLKLFATELMEAGIKHIDIEHNVILIHSLEVERLHFDSNFVIEFAPFAPNEIKKIKISPINIERFISPSISMDHLLISSQAYIKFIEESQLKINQSIKIIEQTYNEKWKQ